MKFIHSDAAPAALGPYSQAVQVGQLLFVSGQLPLKDGTLIDDAAEATSAALTNLLSIVQAAGGGKESFARSISLSATWTILTPSTVPTPTSSATTNRPALASKWPGCQKTPSWKLKSSLTSLNSLHPLRPNSKKNRRPAPVLFYALTSPATSLKSLQ